MATLEQLVPPFELCRKIPADAFGDSVFVWVIYNECFDVPNGKSSLVKFRAKDDSTLQPNAFMSIVPAPTAQEILEAMPDYHLWADGDNAIRFSARCENGTGAIVKTPSKLPEMLLSVWMTVRRMKE